MELQGAAAAKVSLQIPEMRRHPSSDNNDDNSKVFNDHNKIMKRIKKTLYYGQIPRAERLSLPLSELVVEAFAKVVPGGLGRLDMDYTASISRNACVSPCAMILALAYIERVRHRSPQYLQRVSSSDLFLVSLMVASKFLYDAGENEEVFNDEWAALANVDVKDVNKLEIAFLDAIDWEVYVDYSTFAHYLHCTELILAGRKSTERGWSTYSELDVLCNNIHIPSCRHLLLNYVMKVIAVSAIAYSASVFTIFGATLAVNHMWTTTSLEFASDSALPLEFTKEPACKHSLTIMSHFQSAIATACTTSFDLRNKADLVTKFNSRINTTAHNPLNVTHRYLSACS